VPKIDGPDTPDAESLAFEAEIVRRVTGAISAGIDELVTAILAAFEGARLAAGGVLTPEAARSIGAALAARLAVNWTPMAPGLIRAATEARDLGVVRAVRRIPPGETHHLATTANWRGRLGGRPPRVPNADQAMRDGIAEAQAIARAGVRTRHDAAAVAGRLRATRARIQGHARLVANEGINAGTAEVALTIGHRLLWVAERNACLDCLAHAGYAVEPGDMFPALSFDPNARGVLPVKYPPLHPNCRCQVRTFDGPAGAPDPDRSKVDPAARLAAEARRSVVYQWTDHESGPAAMRAAESLLAAGAGLPSSVVKRARIALRKGGVGRPR